LPLDRLPVVRAPDPAPRPEPPATLLPLRRPPDAAAPAPRFAAPPRAPPTGTLGRITLDDSSL
jgi:hypothetical protein